MSDDTEGKKSISLSLRSQLSDALENVGVRLDKSAERLNEWASSNAIGRWFNFKGRNAKLTVECRAGFITFLMVSYVLAVLPNVLITTGGTCNPKMVCTNYETLGSACLGDAKDKGAQACLESLKANLITATAASSLISTFVMGLMANLPLALAPGVGISAYVAYQVVGQFGQGQLTYEQAMTAIFVEGWIFLVLSVTGVRGGLVKYMPKSIAMASSVGIGLLLAFTGLHNLGAIAFNSNTFVGLGGCNHASQTYIYSFSRPLTNISQPVWNLTATSTGTSSQYLPVPAAVHGCTGATMRSATMWLGISGGVLMAVLMFAGVKGSMVIGILFVTIISWIPNHSASYLGATSPIEGGEYRLETFKKVVAVPSLDMTGLAWDWSAFGNGHLWLALFTFLYIDLLDCTGTLLSMARLMDHMLPGFMTEQMEFPGQMWAFLSDGVGILVGSMMGATSDTVYIESAAGIEDGGRTGVAAIVVSIFFFLTLFFSPILSSIPPFATGPALVLVGSIMLGYTAHIAWDDIGQAIPAFLTIIIMPFTYSVAYGVIAGLGSYVAIHFPFWLWDLLRYKAFGKAGNRACVSRARVHRKLYVHRDGTEGSISGNSNRGGGGPGYPGGTDTPGDLTYSSYGGFGGCRRPTIGPRGSLSSVVSHGSAHPSEQAPGMGRISGAPMFLRRSVTMPSPSGRTLPKSQSMDSAWVGYRGPSRPSSGQSVEAPFDLEQGYMQGYSPPSPCPRGLHRMQSAEPTAQWVGGRLPLRLQQGNSGSLPRSNSHSGHGGLAALYPEEDLAQRSSSSCHQGTAYRDYIAAQQTGGSSNPGSPQPAEGGLSQSRSLGPSLTFAGGAFRLAGGGSEEPSASHHPSQLRGLRRAVTQSERSLRSLYDAQSHSEPSPRPFMLFGEVEPSPEEGDGGVEGAAPSFRLFGDVQLPPEEGEDGEAVLEGGSGQPQEPSFRLFGDVEELPLESEEGVGSGPQQSFRLFGDVEDIPLEDGDPEDAARPGLPDS